MALLINVAEAKKSSNTDIIKTMSKLADILQDRTLNDPTFDLDDVYQATLADSTYSSPDQMNSPFKIGNNTNMIGVPGIAPNMDGAGGKKNGKYVIPVIQIPGTPPYQAYIEGTQTWVDGRRLQLRNNRGLYIHEIIPGMIISFHHYETKDGNSNRYKIDAVKVVYDSNSNVAIEKLPESAAAFNMPRAEDVELRGGY